MNTEQTNENILTKIKVIFKVHRRFFIRLNNSEIKNLNLVKKLN